MKTSKTDRKENKQQYLKGANHNIRTIRFTPNELAIIEVKMRAEGWTNFSGYIKFKLFGFGTQKGVNAIVQTKSAESIGTLLKHHVMHLANCFVYYRYRYDKDMRQLYQEEGVNIKDWASVTNKWHVALLKKLEEIFLLIRKIALKLGLENYFISETDAMHIDLDKASPEQLDALAEQIMKENIAMGRPNTFE